MKLIIKKKKKNENKLKSDKKTDSTENYSCDDAKCTDKNVETSYVIRIEFDRATHNNIHSRSQRSVCQYGVAMHE